VFLNELVYCFRYLSQNIKKYCFLVKFPLTLSIMFNPAKGFENISL